MFTVKRAALHFDRVAAEAFAADDLGFMEGLVVAAIFFEAPRPIKPSHLAETFSTTRGNVSHAIFRWRPKVSCNGRSIRPTPGRIC